MARVRKSGRNRGIKSVKLGAGDLQEMVKAAVKEAMEEQTDEEETDEKDDTVEASTDDIVGMIEDAVEAVNAKRKAAKADELNPDDVEEILDAVMEKAEGEEEEAKEDTDIGEILEAAVEAVNEKRKSAKADEIGDDVVDEILDAVGEVMADESADEEGKRRKSMPTRIQRKAVRTAKRVQRKYSNFYVNRGTAAKAEKKSSVPPEVLFARAVKCLDVFGRHDVEAAAYHARKKYQDTEMERQFKALAVTNPVDGGYLVPEVYADQIIELLYPKTVIFELGAQKVPLTNGNLNLPKMTSGTRARWGGEQRKIKTTETKFGNIKLSAKRLEAIVPQSRELLMSTSYSADALFANDLMRSMQLGLDYGALYGKGGEFEPVGIVKNEGVEKINAKGLNNADLADANGKITADFPVYVRSKVMSKNVDDMAAGWCFNSMLEGYLMNLKTDTGAYIYRDEMGEGKLLGFQYKVSNQIPTDANGLTELFFGNWADLLVGDQMGLETYTTLDGTWTDENGTQHNAFEENLAATRALMYDDIAARHAESFICCKNIKVM